MTTVAIVPLKPAGTRKTRLAGILDAERRDALSLAMLRHVTATLAGCGAVDRVAILARGGPAGWTGEVLADDGADLNRALGAASAMVGDARLLVIHADLPLLGGEDVAALLAAAAGHAAIACDHAGRGTNALAFARARDAVFAFGPDSLRRHRALLGPAAPVIRRDGLMRDVDTPADLEAARVRGAQLA